MQSTVEVITPKTAELYLKRNVINRSLRPVAIKNYSICMASGEWDLTHQGIAFNKNGDLVDGQNRLHAIIKANVPVKILVTRGLDHPTYRELAVDQGVKRNYSDQYGKEIGPAQVVTFLAKFVEGMYVSNSEINEYYEVFGIYAELLQEKGKASARIFSSSPIRAAAVLRMTQYEEHEEYIKNQYRCLTIQNYPEMSNKVAALAKYYNIGADRYGRQRYGRQTDKAGESNSRFIRAYDAFDPLRKNDTRIAIYNPTVKLAEIREYIRSFFKKDKTTSVSDEYIACASSAIFR